MWEAARPHGAQQLRPGPPAAGEGPSLQGVRWRGTAGGEGEHLNEALPLPPLALVQESALARPHGWAGSQSPHSESKDRTAGGGRRQARLRRLIKTKAPQSGEAPAPNRFNAGMEQAAGGEGVLKVSSISRSGRGKGGGQR